jgi:hypothetical protein
MDDLGFDPAALAADDRPEPTDADRRLAADLARRELDLRAVAARKTRELREALDDWRRVAEVELPEAMRAIGQSEFRLLDGTRVRLEEKIVGAQIDAAEDIAYVEGMGAASAIMTVVTVAFDRGDVEAARDVVKLVRESRAGNRIKSLVYAATAGALAREWQAQGKAPDLAKMGNSYKVVRAFAGDRAPKTLELKGFDDGRGAVRRPTEVSGGGRADRSRFDDLPPDA